MVDWPKVQLGTADELQALQRWPARLPFVPYRDRFERDAVWDHFGPRILAKICRHMDGKSMVPMHDADTPNTISVVFPELPQVRNIFGERISIFWTIPEFALPPFVTAFRETTYYRIGDVRRIERHLPAHTQINQAVLNLVKAQLMALEMERIQRADPFDPPLADCLAERFGLDPLGSWRSYPDPYEE